MKILIVGATGGTGRELVRQALARDWVVTALVRDRYRLPFTDPKLRVMEGDVLDPCTLDAAVTGQDAVICVLGHKRWFYPNSILSRGTRNLIAAMQRAGVTRFVCQTSLGVGSSFGRLGLYYTLFVVPFILPFYYWDKARQERVVRDSTLDWTIVRPAALTNRPAKGRYRHGPNIGNWILTLRVPRADVAHFLLELAATGADIRRTTAIAS